MLEALQDRQGVAAALRLAGLIAIEAHDFSRAREPFERSLALSRELGDERGAAWSAYGIAATALAEGDLVQATALGEGALRAFESLGERDGTAQSLVHLGRVALARGRHEEALRLHHEALRIRRELADPGMIASSLRELAVVAQDQGAAEQAAPLYRESLDLFERAGDLLGVARSLDGLAVLAADGGQAETAARLFGAADALLQRVGVVPWPGWFPSELPRRRREHARSGVRRLLDPEAYRRATEAGSSLPVSVAAAEALAVAARPPHSGRRSAPRAEPLTPRELEVAGLVALGLSNREIARRLFISENTAATHVQHILGKLDFSSRAQIATWAVERGLKPPA